MKIWPAAAESLIKERPSVYLRKRPKNPRKSALRLLTEVEESQKDLSLLIDNHLNQNTFEPRDKALITELVYGVFRQRGYLDWQIEHFSKVKVIKRPIRQILRIALYQLLFLNRIPSYAIVNTSVEISKEAGGIAAARFVNGLLRTLIRQKEQLPQPEPSNRASFIAITTSHPEWMVKRWLARWGEEKTFAICRANNEAPPMTLRVNRLKANRTKLAAELEAAGGMVETSALSPDGLTLKGLSVRSLPAFQEGQFYIQDEGAQLISHLVDPQAGETLLDLCSAPGGKTTHLAELTQGKARVIATDINADRLAFIQENIKRLQTPGIQIKAMRDALAPARKYDRILIDAPCSALGILRRIPEGKWRKSPSIVASNAVTQLEILEKAWLCLKTGGRLIYATCSTEAEENEDLAEAFMRAHPEMVIENPSNSLPPPARRYINEKGYFTSLFNSDRMDLFFAVRWIKGA